MEWLSITCHVRSSLMHNGMGNERKHWQREDAEVVLDDRFSVSGIFCVGFNPSFVALAFFLLLSQYDV